MRSPKAMAGDTAGDEEDISAAQSVAATQAPTFRMIRHPKVESATEGRNPWSEIRSRPTGTFNAYRAPEVPFVRASPRARLGVCRRVVTTARERRQKR